MPRGPDHSLPPQLCPVVDTVLGVVNSLLGSVTCKCCGPFLLSVCPPLGSALLLGFVFLTLGTYKCFSNFLKTQLSIQAQHSISPAPEQQQAMFPAESHFRTHSFWKQEFCCRTVLASPLSGWECCEQGPPTAQISFGTMVFGSSSSPCSLEALLPVSHSCAPTRGPGRSPVHSVLPSHHRRQVHPAGSKRECCQMPSNQQVWVVHPNGVAACAGLPVSSCLSTFTECCCCVGPSQVCACAAAGSLPYSLLANPGGQHESDWLDTG